MHRQDLNHARGFSRTLSEFSAEQSCLQLSFQFSQKSPIGSFSDQRVGIRLDHPDIVEAKRVKAQRVFRIIGAPAVVSQAAKRSQSMLVIRRKSPVYDIASSPSRILGAQVHCFEESAKRSLGRNRILP